MVVIQSVEIILQEGGGDLIIELLLAIMRLGEKRATTLPTRPAWRSVSSAARAL